VTPPAQGHQCTILIVDDDREVQELLRLALTADGYQVAVASTGRDALDYLRSHAETCAILLDLMLPGMDGTEFLAAQQRDRSLAWIPVVVMSAAVDAEARVRALAPRRVLRKPLDLDAVRRAVGQIASINCRYRFAPAELAGRKGRPLSSE
jgi:CheY-like chemotaxis protein